jgi:hypothetical protein
MSMARGQSLHRVSNVNVRSKLAAAQKASEWHAGHYRHRPPPDPRYLETLAQRLPKHCGLPVTLAHKRVMALAVSARPRGERWE